MPVNNFNNHKYTSLTHFCSSTPAPITLTGPSATTTS